MRLTLAFTFLCSLSAIAVRAQDSLQVSSLLYEDSLREVHWFPWLGLNSDDGFFLGGILEMTNYDDSSFFYKNRDVLKAGYAIGANRLRLIYEHEFPDIYTGTLTVWAQISGLEVLNFFGYGNNTPYSKAAADDDLYRVNHYQFSLVPNYSISPREHITLQIHAGIGVFSTSTDMPDSAVLRRTNTYGSESATFAVTGMSGTYDSRDNTSAPQEGAYFTIGTAWNPEIFDNSFAYTKARSEFRGYYTAPVLEGLTLAVRARGEKIFGNRFPFYDAVFLGGINDLRGYARERFAGDASVLTTIEARANIGNFTFVAPCMYGAHAFAEEGRVFFDGETSEARHGSFGGGVWIAPYGIQNTIALTLAKSPEQLTFAITGGFAF